MAAKSFYGTGKRKTSIARVWLKPGAGVITVNNKTLEDYFGRETSKMVIRQPLELTENVDKFDIFVIVKGSRDSGQAGAIKSSLSNTTAPTTAGWQVQPNGLAIQQVMEEALAKLLGAPVQAPLLRAGPMPGFMRSAWWRPSGRTATMPLRAFSDGLNTLLPPDIAVKEAVEAPPGFNPRADADGQALPLHHLQRATPVTAVAAVCVAPAGTPRPGGDARGGAHFVGEHDFAAFRTSGCAARTTVRRIDSVEISRNGDFVIIDVRGSGFLRNMVRIMVGTLVEVGKGKRSPDCGCPASGGEKRLPGGGDCPLPWTLPDGSCLLRAKFFLTCDRFELIYTLPVKLWKLQICL